MSTERYSEIDKKAGDWLAQRDSGNWTDEHQRRFEQWLNESPLHRVAYLRIEHVWERSERLRALGAGIPPGVVPPRNGWNLSPFFERRDTASDRENHGADTRSRVTVRHGLRALAAGILLSTALTGGYYLWPSGIAYRTPVGGLASVPMPDGSKVILNTNSEIRVAVTEKERRVELQQGEAFFEVAPDQTRPFVVRAGNKRVVAVGTKFSVRRNTDDVDVVVTEGKVRVETGGSPGTPEKPDTGTLVTAGTIAQASDAGVLLRTKVLAEAEESLSWRQGVLVFRQMTLAEASAEFNRYNTRKVVVEDPDIAGLRVAGSFRANNVEAFVRLLERGYPLRAEEEGDRFVLVAR